MKQVICFVMLCIFCGCAKVNLATSKPLKVDINLRVDVYQHVAKDAESIEDQIYGSGNKQINAICLFESAFAQEEPSGLTSVIENRKARAGKIDELLAKGYAGENKNAYLELLPSAPADSAAIVQGILNEENADRKKVYQAIAQKNGADLEGVEKTFFKDHYKRAPAGYWFQVHDEARNAYNWQQK